MSVCECYWPHPQESELRQKLADAEADAAQSKGGHKRLRERCDAAEAAAETAHRALRTAKEEAAAAAQVRSLETAMCRLHVCCVVDYLDLILFLQPHPPARICPIATCTSDCAAGQLPCFRCKGGIPRAMDLQLDTASMQD